MLQEVRRPPPANDKMASISHAKSTSGRGLQEPSSTSLPCRWLLTCWPQSTVLGATNKSLLRPSVAPPGTPSRRAGSDVLPRIKGDRTPRLLGWFATNDRNRRHLNALLFSAFLAEAPARFALSWVNLGPGRRVRTADWAVSRKLFMATRTPPRMDASLARWAPPQLLLHKDNESTRRNRI